MMVMTTVPNNEKYYKVTFEYCTKCRWALRANWMAQELLATFCNNEINEVSLIPTAEPAGTFTIRINGDVIWDRRDESTAGFPEAKELKQIVRDYVAPTKDLGHSDNKPKVLELFEQSNTQDETISEKEKIKEVLGLYLDGLYEGDVSKISAAFHPTCLLTSYNETTNEVGIVTRDKWLDLVRNRDSPGKLRLQRHDEILSIDVISNCTAFVKLNCAIPPRYFTDSLNLMKLGGQWVIMQKLFAVEYRD